MSTWMVVEDEPDIYEVLLAMFGIWGIEGVAFVDGEEAVSWIEDVDHKRFQGELPELALLDIRLPGEINGPAVVERLRKSQSLRDMAIVLTTAYKLTPDEEEEVIQQAEADRLVYKPLPKFGELQTLLEGTIAERRAKVTTAVEAEPEREPEEQDESEELKLALEFALELTLEPEPEETPVPKSETKAKAVKPASKAAAPKAKPEAAKKATPVAKSSKPKSKGGSKKEKDSDSTAEDKPTASDG